MSDSSKYKSSVIQRKEEYDMVESVHIQTCQKQGVCMAKPTQGSGSK